MEEEEEQEKSEPLKGVCLSGPEKPVEVDSDDEGQAVEGVWPTWPQSDV